MTGGWKDQQTKHSHFYVYNSAKKIIYTLKILESLGKLEL